MLKPLALACVATTFFACGATAWGEENWPQFRGPGARGIGAGDALPDRWSATENVAWKTDLPGRGWSSPIVWGDRVFLTTVINSGDSEKPRKGLYFGGDRPTPVDAVHQWKVICLNLETGEVAWERLAHESKPETPIHLKNSYASETPVTDGERVYCYFGGIGVFCFDFDGNEIWRRPLAPHRMRNGWGTAASPVWHAGRLYLVNDNDEDSYLLALDAATGEELWRIARDERSNWATPYVWQNEERTEIVTPGSGKVRSYDLEGALLWSLAGMSSITIATPYEYGGLLYVSSGYVIDPSRPIYAIRPGAEGDISLADDEESNEWVAWVQRRAAPYNPSTLVYEDRLYVLYDMGLLACFDPADGSEVFAAERIPDGGSFTASPWAYSGRVFCLNEDGMTTVLAAGDEFDVSHANALAEDDMCMATPAIAGDRLLIRTSERLYCIRAGGQEAGGEADGNAAVDGLEPPTLTLCNDNIATEIDEALRQITAVDCKDYPLDELLASDLAQRHAIKIELDETAIRQAGVEPDVPVTHDLQGITLKGALDIIVSAQGLIWEVRGVRIVITAKKKQ